MVVYTSDSQESFSLFVITLVLSLSACAASPQRPRPSPLRSQTHSFGDEFVYSSSDDPDLSVYAARRPDGALTIMLVNLALEEKTKALRIGDRTQVQAEMWLFDPSHQVENLGTVELSGQIPVLPQSISLYIIQE